MHHWLFNRKEFISGRMKIEDGLVPLFDKVRVLIDRKKVGADGKPLKDAKGNPVMEKIGKLDAQKKPVYDLVPVIENGFGDTSFIFS